MSGTARDRQVESCARCHSRRVPIAAWEHGHPLLDTHWPSLLEEGLYFPDGQILDEVYVYGSFLQSRMYQAGVTCSDCHEPHSLTLRASGNALCTRCHEPKVYDVREHHFHEPGTRGASCVECHMPARTYMVVDPRRDHSIRIPRPDLSIALGVPNACQTCHADKSAQWLADAIEARHGPPGHSVMESYAIAFDRARRGAPGAGDALLAVARDPDVPDIVRATAVRHLGDRPGAATMSHLTDWLDHDNALVRRAAAEAFESADPATRWRVLADLLDDPIRVVRLAAVNNLLDIRPDEVDQAGAVRLASALREFASAQMFNADRAEAWVNLARLYAGQGEVQQAEHAYEQARRRDRRYVPAYLNHADLERSLGREAEAECALAEGLKIAPDDAALRHSLGLLYVRTGRMVLALPQLEAAYRNAPDQARFGFVYGAALQATGQHARAIDIWQAVLEADPYDPDVLAALSAALRDRGELDRALVLARRLQTVMPDDHQVRAHVESIRRQARTP